MRYNDTQKHMKVRKRMFPSKVGATGTFPLDISAVTVQQVSSTAENDYLITVASTGGSTRCRVCGQEISHAHGYGDWLPVRPLPILGQRVYLRLRPKRYRCPTCPGRPTTTQSLSWYVPHSPHTVAYDRPRLLQLIGSTVADVCQKERLGYEAGDGAVARQLQRTVNWDDFTALPVLGIDEIALPKGHGNFVALITAQQTADHGAGLAVLPDRKKETVRQFLESIPERLRRTLQTAGTDMWDGYVNALREFAPAHPEVTLDIVVDRYHVAKSSRDAVDKVRQTECRRLKKELTPAAYAELKGVLWGVRQNHGDLTPEERQQLRLLFTYSPQLKAAYTLHEELTAIFERPLTKSQARRRLRQWMDKVRRQKMACFAAFW